MTTGVSGVNVAFALMFDEDIFLTLFEPAESLSKGGILRPSVSMEKLAALEISDADSEPTYPSGRLNVAPLPTSPAMVVLNEQSSFD